MKRILLPLVTCLALGLASCKTFDPTYAMMVHYEQDEPMHYYHVDPAYAIDIMIHQRPSPAQQNHVDPAYAGAMMTHSTTFNYTPPRGYHWVNGHYIKNTLKLHVFVAADYHWVNGHYIKNGTGNIHHPECPGCRAGYHWVNGHYIKNGTNDIHHPECPGCRASHH